MAKRNRRITRSVIIRAFTRLGELCADSKSRVVRAVDAIVGDYYAPRELDDPKRWLIEQLLKEVRDEKRPPV